MLVSFQRISLFLFLGVFLPVTLVVLAIVVCLLCVAYEYKNNRSNVQATYSDMG